MLSAEHLLPLYHVRRLAVLRALPGLGDFLCATPALRALRTGLPDAHITLIGLPWLSSLSPRYALWDDLLPFPGAPGLPEVPLNEGRLETFLNAHRGRFDAALQLHGSGPQSNTFVSALHAPFTAGFCPAEQKPPSPHFLPWQEDEHEVTRWLRLLSHLGIPARGAELGVQPSTKPNTAVHFPLGPSDIAQANALERKHHLSSYIVLHPGAASEAKRWPVERFAAVGREAQALGLQVVITGSAGERALAATLHRHLPGAVNLCGETDLGTLAALLSGARLLVCNDTGVSHLAAATRTPSVVLFSETDPARWAPLGRARHRALGGANTAVDVDTVLAVTRTLLLGGDHEHPDLARPRGVPLLPNA